jgi:hypothetical protein
MATWLRRLYNYLAGRRSPTIEETWDTKTRDSLK